MMVQHNLDLAIQAAKDLKEHRPKLYARLGITQEEIDHMGVLRKAIKWPHDPVTGRLAQDETLHLLEPVDMSEVKLGAGASYGLVCVGRVRREGGRMQGGGLVVRGHRRELPPCVL